MPNYWVETVDGESIYLGTDAAGVRTRIETGSTHPAGR